MAEFTATDGTTGEYNKRAESVKEKKCANLVQIGLITAREDRISTASANR